MNDDLALMMWNDDDDEFVLKKEQLLREPTEEVTKAFLIVESFLRVAGHRLVPETRVKDFWDHMSEETLLAACQRQLDVEPRDEHSASEEDFLTEEMVKTAPPGDLEEIAEQLNEEYAANLDPKMHPIKLREAILVWMKAYG